MILFSSRRLERKQDVLATARERSSETEKLPSARRNLAALLTMCVIFALTTGCQRNGGKNNRTKTDSAGIAFREMFKASMREERLVPGFHNGEIVGLSQKPRELLRYIVEDYRRIDLGHGQAVSYSAITSWDNIGAVASGMGQFSIGDKPPASYFITIGADIAAAQRAIVLTLIEGSEGAFEMKSTIYWDESSKQWKLERQEGPGEHPATIHKLAK